MTALQNSTKQTEEPREGATAGKVNPTAEHIDGINMRLSEILFSLLAIHRFAYEALEMGDDERETFINHMVAIAEMSRANIKGLDACIEQLGGGKQGNFETEFTFR